MIVYVLAKYDKDERLVSRRIMPGVSRQIMQDVYALDADDPVAGAYAVDETNRHRFERMLGERLDLDKFSYFIEPTTINDNRSD